MLYYITGNADKINSANFQLQKYGLEVSQKEISFIEIQSNSQEKIVRHKIEQALQIMKEPFIVSDTGWQIPALRGFPGAYMHDINEWFTAQDFLNLIMPYTDRTVIMQSTICYRDQEQSKIFSLEQKGIILEEPKGKGCPSDMVFSFREDKKSIAECRIEQIEYISNKHTVWDDFGRWYLSFKEGNL